MVINLLRKLDTVNINFVLYRHLIIQIQSEYPIQHLRDKRFIAQRKNGIDLSNLLRRFFLRLQCFLSVRNFHWRQNFLVTWQTYSDIISFRQQLRSHAEIEHSNQQYK
ncbi:hypothetical protein D3C73_1257710 [compost metagenome]